MDADRLGPLVSAMAEKNVLISSFGRGEHTGTTVMVMLHGNWRI